MELKGRVKKWLVRSVDADAGGQNYTGGFYYADLK